MISVANSAGELTLSADSVVQIEAKGDQTKLKNVPIGTVAYTAGFGNMYQLKNKGLWAIIVEET